MILNGFSTFFILYYYYILIYSPYNAFPAIEKNNFAFTQRIRLGIKIKEFQFGVGLDLSQLGRINFTKTQNLGGFLRYEF